MKEYRIKEETLKQIAGGLRIAKCCEEEFTPEQMAQESALLGIPLPKAEPVRFSEEQITTDPRYSIGNNWFARLVERVKLMVGLDRDFTPEEILYWLGRVAVIPQGFAESAFELGFVSGASGKLPTVHTGTANSEFTLNFESSAAGALSA